MKKHLIALLLAAALVLSMAGCKGKAADIPKVGDTTNGFTVSEVSRVESLDADVVKLTHDKTGARVIFVLNDDNNLGYSTCFHTEPADDTGMLHILEHAVCAASEKYPGRDVFFDAIAQAYLTDLNAWTSLSSTNYYATSMDENQLEVLADFYLDCAFNSAILTEPNYFYREGWRYEMPTLEDDLTINGIVYNEMQGVYGNIYNAASSNVGRALFPDTYQSRESGGNPDVIPDLSYEELIDFYKSCYNPANSVTMFYGNVNMERFLAFLNDNYFSVVDAGEKAAVSPCQKAFTEPVHVVDQFPVAAGSEDTGSVLYYSVAMSEEDSADYTNYCIGDIVTTLLSDNSSALMQELNASGIGSQYGAYINNAGTQLSINFYAADADAARDEEFKEIILSKLSEMTEAGFSEDMLRSLFSSRELALRLERNSSNVAVSLFNNLTWIQEMGNDAPLNAAEWFKKADELCVPGYAEGKMLDWVVNNPHAALVSTVPAPGLLEKNEQAHIEKLAEIKAGMTDEEKQAIVDETAAFNEWVQLETPEETLKKVSVVDAATVSANLPEHKIKTEVKDGVTIYTAPSTMDMTSINLAFDVSHLTDSELCRLKMLSYVFGCSTESHSQEEITMSLAKLTNSPDAGLSVLQLEDSYYPAFTITWFAPNESVAESVNLAFELLESTDLSANADLLAQSLDSAISGYRDPETVNGTLGMQVAASYSGRYGLLNKLGGMFYLSELNAAKAEYDEDPEAFIQSLTALRDKAFQRSGARVMLVGDAAAAQKAIIAKLGELPETCGEALPRDDMSTVKSTVFVGSTQASYLVRGKAFENAAESVTGDKMVLNQLLRGEYMVPQLRFKMGAYNASIYLSLSGLWAAQYYRGGTVFDADQIIMGMPDYIENLDITQAQLDSYKLPAISGLLTSSGELNDTTNEIMNSLSGFTREKQLALIEEIRGVTVEDIKALAPELRDMLDESSVAIITSAGELSGHEDSFDLIEQLP